MFQTKGDFNELPDNWRFVLPQPTQDKVLFHIPYVGYAFELLSVPQYRKIVIGLPAVLVAMWVIAGLWKEGGEAQRRRERGIAPWSERPRTPRCRGSRPVGAMARHSRRGAVLRAESPGRGPARGRRRGALPRRAAARCVPASRAGGRSEPRRVALPAACVARARGRLARATAAAGGLAARDPSPAWLSGYGRRGGGVAPIGAR